MGSQQGKGVSQKKIIAGTIVAGVLIICAIVVLILAASIDFGEIIQKMMDGMTDDLSIGELIFLAFTGLLFIGPMMVVIVNYAIIIVGGMYALVATIISAVNASKALTPRLRGWNIAILIVSSLVMMVAVILFVIALGSPRKGGETTSEIAAIIGFLAR